MHWKGLNKWRKRALILLLISTIIGFGGIAPTILTHDHLFIICWLTGYLSTLGACAFCLFKSEKLEDRMQKYFFP